MSSPVPPSQPPHGPTPPMPWAPGPSLAPCTAKMNGAESGQRPVSTDKAAVKLCLQGGEAAYHLNHPTQVIEDGIRCRSGTKPSTGSCPSRWYAAGKGIALAANEEPLIN